MLNVLESVRLHVYEKETEKNFIFAGLFYFLILVPQTLRKMFGIEVEYDFYHCTGWPLISAGLGGSLPPSQILKEASLYPCEVERNNFHSMLAGVIPFMDAELRTFFIHPDKEIYNDGAYERMMTNLGDKIEDFLLKINEEANKFTDLFKVD